VNTTLARENILKIDVSAITITVFTAVIILLLSDKYTDLKDWRKARKIYEWIKNNTNNERSRRYTVSTDAIAAGCNIEPKRVDSLCHNNKKIYKNKNVANQWGLTIYKDKIDRGPGVTILN
jgi:hypothetical protein